MDLVFLHGPPASGKLTTARALERPVGYPVFHDQAARGVLDGGVRRGRRARPVLARFNEAGTLTYDERLATFSHRVLVRVPAGPAEEDEAHTAGELAAIEHLDAARLGYRNLRSTVTCVDDVKIRRR
ncbi:DUF6204 family protein [Geodermatophilus sp. SYSU D00691]